jgi:hypothetical protein
MPAPTCNETLPGCPDEVMSVVPTHEAGVDSTREAAPPDDGPGTDPDVAQNEGAVDASDAAPPAPLRCGGGDLGDASFCSPSEPLCCMTTQADGGAQYACSTESECSASNDYQIHCAGPQDCASGYVCCHFRTSIVCTLETTPEGGPGHCLDGQHGGSVVCDHSLSNTCPQGSTCSVPLDNGNVYYACSM